MGRYPWTRLGVLLLAAMVLTPLVLLLGSWFQVDLEIWQHIREYVLWDITQNTLVLVVSVALLAGLLGTFAAMAAVLFEFPGRRQFEILFLVPLAFPAYVLAFIYSEWMGYGGIWETILTTLWVPKDSFLMHPTPAWKAPIVLSLALYPYVYLLARQAFRTSGHSAIEVARSLGQNRTKALVRVVLPLAVPWILAGLTLVAMETAADFGAVAILSLDTFTTEIYKSWDSRHSIHSAGQLASLLIGFILLLLLAKNFFSSKAGFRSIGNPNVAANRIKPGYTGQCLLVLLSTFLILAACVLPVLQLLMWTVDTVAVSDSLNRHLSLLTNSALLGLSGASILMALTLFLVFAIHFRMQRGSGLWVEAITLGYAVPGSVLAIAVFGFLLTIQSMLPFLDFRAGLFALLMGLCIRFFAVSFRSLEHTLERVPRSVIDSSGLLAPGLWVKFRKLILPLTRPGLITGFLLCSIEIMKEMPMTLMMRPFGWDTLSVEIFELTAEGMWEEAAFPALCLVTLSCLPVIFLMRREKLL